MAMVGREKPTGAQPLGSTSIVLDSSKPIDLFLTYLKVLCPVDRGVFYSRVQYSYIRNLPFSDGVGTILGTILCLLMFFLIIILIRMDRTTW